MKLTASLGTLTRVSEGFCSDCGQRASWRVRGVDEDTRSTVELCANCAPALLQRQQLSQGCCG